MHSTAALSDKAASSRQTAAVPFLLASLLACLLLASCSPKKPKEDTPAVRRQLDNAEMQLEAANRAAERRIEEACGEENPDC